MLERRQLCIYGRLFGVQASPGSRKQSGNGREPDRFSAEESLEYKSLTLKPEAKA